MAKSSRQFATFIVAAMILLAALSRLLPHPPNFTPVSGMALFGAAYFSRKYLAYLVPFLALWISNLILDNVIYAQYYDGFQWFSQPYVFLAIVLIALFGSKVLRKINLGRIIGASLGASVIFFLVSNFGAWMHGHTYPLTFEGLMTCYWMAIPFLSNPGAEHYFFLNSVIGDLFYTGVLFGSFALIRQSFPQLTWRGQEA